MQRRRLSWTCSSKLSIGFPFSSGLTDYCHCRALKNATAKNQQAQHQLEEQRKKEEVSCQSTNLITNLTPY